MSQSQDTAHLSQSKPAGAEGIRAVIKFYKDGTQEVQDLLNNECDTLFECRYCRAIFRSIINFTAHKRQYCKGTFGAINANASVLWEEYLENMSKEQTNDTEEGRARRSLMHVLNRRALDVSVEVPGHPDPLILHTYPRIGRDVKPEETAILGISSKDDGSIPEDRVPVAFPTDPNFRQKTQTQMKMRSKRDGILANSGADLSTHEMACLHRLLKFQPDVIGEGSKTKCNAPECKDVKVFASYAFLAYHVGMKHSSRTADNDKIPCFLCNHTIKTWASYYGHYVRVHKLVREEHDKGRMLSELGPDAKRRDYRRGRSLSPEADGAAKDACEMNGGELKTEESSPPAIHPIDGNETGEEDDEQDSMPKLARMTTRRRKSRVGRSQSQDELKALSRCSTPSSYSTELTDNNGLTLEEILEKKFDKDIAAAVEMLISETEELMGDKPLKPKLEKKSSGSGRSTPGSQKGKRGKKAAAKSANNNGDDEENEEKDEDDVPLSHFMKKQEEGTRQSRTRKRPGWMEGYLMDDGEKISGKKQKTDDFLPLKEERKEERQVTPQKTTARYSSSKAQNTRSATKRSPAEEEIPTKYSRKEKVKAALMKSSPGSSLNLGQDIVLPEDPGTSKATRRSCLMDDDDRMLTPRARKIIEDIDAPSSPGSSRRKQDMSLARDSSDEVRIISTNGKVERYTDLSTVPVYLSQAQRDLFFSGLKPKDPTFENDKPSDGEYYCEFCNLEMASLKEGRRHMVGHIRVMRLRCKLCGAGAFFCTDMRMHLQDRCCPKLHKAPEGFVKFGKPCMSRHDADHLTEVVDLTNPGRVCFTSGQIVSSLSKVPYFPDPVIEERILGPSRVPGHAHNSPQKARSTAVRRF